MKSNWDVVLESCEENMPSSNILILYLKMAVDEIKQLRRNLGVIDYGK